MRRCQLSLKLGTHFATNLGDCSSRLKVILQRDGLSLPPPGIINLINPAMTLDFPKLKIKWVRFQIQEVICSLLPRHLFFSIPGIWFRFSSFSFRSES